MRAGAEDHRGHRRPRPSQASATSAGLAPRPRRAASTASMIAPGPRRRRCAPRRPPCRARGSRRAGWRRSAASSRWYLPASQPPPSGDQGRRPMPASRQAGTTSCSMSRTRRLYCGCSVTGGAQPRGLGDVDGLGDVPAEEVREAVVGDLAGAHRVVEEAQRLLERGQRVPGVHLVEVDPLDPEPPERGVERVGEVAAREAEVVRARPHREAALGGDHHLRGLGRVRVEPAADDLLGDAGSSRRRRCR